MTSSANETKALLDYLAAVGALSAYIFWGDAETPPPTYTPANGVGVCLKVRGGSDDDSGAVMDPSFQFKIYAINEVTARSAARAIHDNLERAANKDLLAARREVLPVTLRDPESQWIYTLVFYKIMIRNS